MIGKKLGVKAHIIPMCNEPVETYIQTPTEYIHFEEYFIKNHCEPNVIKIDFKGIDKAKPVDGVLEYIKDAIRIIICPSNPIVSIGTILKVPKIRDALIGVKEKVFAITPIIAGASIKGPTDKFMKCLGLDVSCIEVAKYYQDFLGNFIIDNKDINLKPIIERLGIKTYSFDTLMTNLQKKVELAQFIIKL